MRRWASDTGAEMEGNMGAVRENQKSRESVVSRNLFDMHDFQINRATADHIDWVRETQTFTRSPQ